MYTNSSHNTILTFNKKLYCPNNWAIVRLCVALGNECICAGSVYEKDVCAWVVWRVCVLRLNNLFLKSIYLYTIVFILRSVKNVVIDLYIAFSI